MTKNTNRGGGSLKLPLIPRLIAAIASIATITSLGLAVNTALADETDDSLSGLTEEELAQLDEQLGIMPMAACTESGAPDSPRSADALVAIDIGVDGAETSPPTNGYGQLSGVSTSGGLQVGLKCGYTRIGVHRGTAPLNPYRPSGTARGTWTWTMNKDMWVYVESGQAGFDQITINGPNGAWRVKAGDYCTAKVNYSGPHGGTYFSCGGKTVDASNKSGGDGNGIYSMAVNFTTLWPGDGPEPEPDEPDPVYYTLSYNANGGSGTMSGTTAEEGTRVTVKPNGFTRSGYTFLGWATSPSGSVVYDPGDSITLNSNRTLYAKWQKNTVYYTLTYNKNASDATGSTASQTVEEGKSVSLRQNGFTRPGYQFTGWGTSTSGGTIYQPGNSLTLNSNRTLYAQWDPITVRVNYDPNGGEGSHDPTEGKANGTVTIPSDVNDPFHRDHYTLTGWNTKPDGSGDDYAPNDTIHMGIADQTLYAQWERIPVKVNYDPNGGTGSHDPTDGDAGDPITIPDDLNDPFSKPGSILIGWNTKPDGTGDSYQPGDDVPMDDEDKTLYAQWKELVDVLPSTGGDGIDLPLLPIVAGGVLAMLLLAVGVVFKVRRSRR